MPKAKIERVISDDGVMRTVEVDVTERDKTKVAKYSIPSSAKAFSDMVTGLTDTLDGGAFYRATFHEDPSDTDESPLALAYRLWCVAIDRKARADVYESIAAESTLISVGKEKIDVLTLPLAKLVKAINGMRAQVELRAATGGDTPEARASAEKSVGYGPWRVATRKLIEEGKVRENEATGTLELVSAGA